MRAIRFAYKPVVFLACLAPLLWLVARALEAGAPGLGPNPVEVIQDTLGIWGLRFILITLAVTPFRRIIGAAWPAQFRRMLGLFAFSYISLHFLAYLLLDQTLDMAAIIEDIAERPYITIGFSAWTLMTPLAITSTKGWRRRLRKRWQSLHRLVYAIAILGCWHFYWQVKKDLREPLVYAGILAVLLAYRLWLRRSRQ